LCLLNRSVKRIARSIIATMEELDVQRSGDRLRTVEFGVGDAREL
jgi:hypothetical protein